MKQLLTYLPYWKKLVQGKQHKELESLQQQMQSHAVITSEYSAAQIDDDAILLTDAVSLAGECSRNQIPYLFLLHDQNKHESLPCGAYCVESLSDVSYEYLDKVYRRAKGLPWKIVTTKRLEIREIMVEDVPRLYELYADECITRYMEPLFPVQQQEEEYTRDYIKNIYHFYGYGMWLIVLKAEGKVIGRAGLEYKEGFEGLELGFMLGKEYQHQGYAYEACQAILDYAREELEQTRFRAMVHRENMASRQLCEKLGFRIEEGIQTSLEDYLEYHLKKVL